MRTTYFVASDLASYRFGLDLDFMPSVGMEIDYVDVVARVVTDSSSNLDNIKINRFIVDRVVIDLQNENAYVHGTVLL